jgi:hypothetical protein
VASKNHTPDTPQQVNDSPWWVRALADGGRPVVAVTVLIFCAPGEHHLAVLAGWNPTLAWLMSGTLAAYAGIAAGVASRMAKGSPGKNLAENGARSALLIAMIAQPISHLFVTGWLSADPRPPMWLVIFVSCIPAPVLYHVLHVGAAPSRARTGTPVTAPEAPAPKPVPASAPEADTPAPKPATPPVALPTLPDGLMTTRQFMQAKGVSRQTLSRWKNAGTLVPHAVDPVAGNLYHPDQLTA